MPANGWWRPDELSASERAFRSIDDVSKLDPKNDFGSYRRMLLGDDAEASLIAMHNDIRPERKVRLVKRTLRLPSSLRVLDVGCGLGFTTAALAESFADGAATGVDISEDAIRYARKHFPRAEFRAMAIAPDAAAIGQFDRVFCFEFYPFTRTADAPLQAGFLRYLVRQTVPGGALVIFQRWDIPQSVVTVLDEVKNLCPELDFRVQEVPHPKLPAILPIWLGLIFSRIVALTGREGVKRVLVVERR